MSPPWHRLEKRPSERPRPPPRLTSLLDHTLGPSGVPFIALARKKAAEVTRLQSSVHAVDIATPAHQTASTTNTDNPFNNPLSAVQSQQNVRKNERARKRPHSAGDLMEDCSTKDLQELVKKAVREAMTP
ncbi:hypothetical protein EX30DRAFT_351699 [Ascodesmis nigricans]|uniref:Uncharacterized protein n=1 Tax=Ascodesmis nigricans TaxID=341454 RepID=A0A4S2MKP4_9PEZI|nr:hypothetical protein EX30DRAFT_351699 [Ascodesmis nigricans]